MYCISKRYRHKARSCCHFVGIWHSVLYTPGQTGEPGGPRRGPGGDRRQLPYSDRSSMHRYYLRYAGSLNAKRKIIDVLDAVAAAAARGFGRIPRSRPFPRRTDRPTDGRTKQYPCKLTPGAEFGASNGHTMLCTRADRQANGRQLLLQQQ